MHKIQPSGGLRHVAICACLLASGLCSSHAGGDVQDAGSAPTVGKDTDAQIAVDRAVQRFRDIERDWFPPKTDEDFQHYDRAITAAHDDLVGEMKPLVPEVLFSIQQAMMQKSDLEILMDQMETTDDPERALELLDEVARRSQEPGVDVPRCELASLIVDLGSDHAGLVGELLVDLFPLPERFEDLCIRTALLDLGPGAYGVLLERALNDTDLNKAYNSCLVLVAGVRNTDFPRGAGLGDNLEANVPLKRPGIRKLARQWSRWWESHGKELRWNAETRAME